MTQQDYINALAGIVVVFGAWWCTNVWAELKASREREAAKAKADTIRDTEVMTKLSTIELLVVGSYAKKEELLMVKSTIEEKLGRIEGLELVMATEYVNKADFNQVIQTLFHKLDRSDLKLDSLIEAINKKADK